MVGTEDEAAEVGVLRPDSEGVRELVGVKRFARESVREWREEGVWGKTIVSLEGVAARLEGVTGKGTAKSIGCGFLVGDLDRDLEGDGDGEVGVARMEEEEGDFGEDEAKRRVSAEGFWLPGSGGKSANGILGTDV